MHPGDPRFADGAEVVGMLQTAYTGAMSVQLFAFTCGWLEAALEMFLPGEEGRIRVPVPSYLIRHPRGQVVFDTGLHPSTQSDPAGRLGFLAEIFRIEFAPGEELPARLEATGVDPERVDVLVNSHLHFDHAGGNALLPNARWIVQRREYEAARDAEIGPANGLHAADWDHGHDVQPVDGEFDLFGDGSVTCLPTWGHTPGHQSLRVHLDSGPVVLAGDACYLRRTLEEGLLPNIVYDRDQMSDSLDRLRELQRRGARIFYGHDPEFWTSLPHGTAIT